MKRYKPDPKAFLEEARCNLEVTGFVCTASPRGGIGNGYRITAARRAGRSDSRLSISLLARGKDVPDAETTGDISFPSADAWAVFRALEIALERAQEEGLITGERLTLEHSVSEKGRQFRAQSASRAASTPRSRGQKRVRTAGKRKSAGR